MLPRNSVSVHLGTILRLAGIVLLCTFFTWYVLFQARNFINGPVITLSNDAAQHVYHEQSLTLTGNAQNIVKLTLNGREIHTNKHGDFSQLLVLENGYTIMTLFAQDRFGRTTTLSREFVYSPQSS
jgi:hypothetical protein